MNINEARGICFEIEMACKGKTWNKIYSDDTELVADLAKVYVPKNKTAPVNTFKGYAYIYSFASAVQSGKTLTDKQLAQAKRIAKEIKKAAAIAEYAF